MKLVNYFKALSDETRLRLVNLLSRHELNVNEIVSLMEMGQSRISRHLKILTDCGVLSSRRDGLMVFYSLSKDGNGREIIDSIKDFFDKEGELKFDIEELENALQERAREKVKFFDSIAPQWDDIKIEILGEIHIPDEIIKIFHKCEIAADLGCGTGDLLAHLKKRAAKVIGVDRSPKMLEKAKQRFTGNGSGIEFRIGEIEHLPMRDSEADAAVINMVLHHLESPEEGLMEASRVLKDGNPLLIVDLDKHNNESMRIDFGHRWLGFSKNEMEQFLDIAGFEIEEIKQYDAEKGMKINLFHAVKK